MSNKFQYLIGYKYFLKMLSDGLLTHKSNEFGSSKDVANGWLETKITP